MASKSGKHSHSWQRVCVCVCAERAKLPINGSVFHPLAVLSFFGCRVGGVETVTGSLATFFCYFFGGEKKKKVKFRSDYTSSQRRNRERLLHTPLMSSQSRSEPTFPTFKLPQSLGALRSAIFRGFQDFSNFPTSCLPALNPGHARLVTHL